MAHSHTPDSCTDDDCNRSTHTREFPFEARTDAHPHPDANEVETICPIHGIVYSR